MCAVRGKQCCQCCLHLPRARAARCPSVYSSNTVPKGGCQLSTPQPLSNRCPKVQGALAWTPTTREQAPSEYPLRGLSTTYGSTSTSPLSDPSPTCLTWWCSHIKCTFTLSLYSSTNPDDHRYTKASWDCSLCIRTMEGFGGGPNVMNLSIPVQYGNSMGGAAIALDVNLHVGSLTGGHPLRNGIGSLNMCWRPSDCTTFNHHCGFEGISVYSLAT